jgi:hypothetical protein
MIRDRIWRYIRGWNPNGWGGRRPRASGRRLLVQRLKRASRHDGLQITTSIQAFERASHGGIETSEYVGSVQAPLPAAVRAASSYDA